MVDKRFGMAVVMVMVSVISPCAIDIAIDNKLIIKDRKNDDDKTLTTTIMIKKLRQKWILKEIVFLWI